MFRLEPLLGLCLLFPAPARALFGHPAGPEVDVCLRMHTSVSMEVLQYGEATAAQLFQDIGVHLHWYCGESPDQVDVSVADSTPRDFHRGAFGYALPYAHRGERVFVFYDRFLPLTISNPTSAPMVLGHIIAHELGHVLCGVASHSDYGLMQAKWTQEDIGLMRLHKLRFTPDVARFILDNLRRVTALKP